ncbi:hypothetical protein GCM10010415_54360 [Streptomyces atrovirens]
MTVARTPLAGIAVGPSATFGMFVGIPVLPVGSAAWRLLTANNAALTPSSSTRCSMQPHRPRPIRDFAEPGEP